MERRTFLAVAGILALGAGPARRQRMTVGFSTYGMPGWPAERALATIARLGFDTAELCLLPTYASAPEKLSAVARAGMRKLLGDTGLGVPALMENLTPSPDEAKDGTARERLKRGIELAHALVPGRPPLIETVLGGGAWDKVKTLFRDRLGGWLEEMAKGRVVLAIKPHRFGAMSLPEQAVWLGRQLKSPWLKMVFDQSHYAHRGLDMAEQVRIAAPLTAFVAVKDTVMREGKVAFELPGETGKMDHVRTLKELAKAGYRGDVNCEVSGMVFGKKGYDAEKAASQCFRAMSRAMREAGVR